MKKISRKMILMNPGPVNVTERVRKALMGPDICHREEEFSDLLLSIRTKLVTLFGIEKTHTAALFSGSGTAALESMLSSYAGSNRKVLVLSNGVYGDRMKNILELHGSPVIVLSAEAGGFPEISAIEKILKNDSSIQAVGLVHHETSTGSLNPLAPVATLTKKYKKTLLLDAISSIGAETIDFKKYPIGFCVGTSGKCLHGFPGVSFVLVAKNEIRHIQNKPARTVYLDLWNTLSHEQKNDTPFTPSVQLFYAFREALEELKTEGLKNRIKNYEKKSRFIEKEAEKLGLKFLIPKHGRSHVLTSFWTPLGLSYEQLHDRLKKAGFVIYAGQSHLKGKIFRISNLGDIQLSDLRRFFKAFKKILPV